jgi:hypothetical protein
LAQVAQRVQLLLLVDLVEQVQLAHQQDFLLQRLVVVALAKEQLIVLLTVLQAVAEQAIMVELDLHCR